MSPQSISFKVKIFPLFYAYITILFQSTLFSVLFPLNELVEIIIKGVTVTYTSILKRLLKELGILVRLGSCTEVN